MHVISVRKSNSLSALSLFLLTPLYGKLLASEVLEHEILETLPLLIRSRAICAQIRAFGSVVSAITLSVDRSLYCINRAPDPEY